MKEQELMANKRFPMKIFPGPDGFTGKLSKLNSLLKMSLYINSFGKQKGRVLLLLLLSRFSRVRPCATPETAAYQGFSRQEHWSGLPFPSSTNSLSSELLISKHDKDSIRKDNYRLTSFLNLGTKIFNKILENKIQQYLERIMH